MVDWCSSPVKILQPSSSVSTNTTKKRTVISTGRAARMDQHVAAPKYRKLTDGTKQSASAGGGAGSSSSGPLFNHDAWNRKFELLRDFSQENGHCQVPIVFEVESVKLGQWAKQQQGFYKSLMEGGDKGAWITMERIAQLNSIGFEWNSEGSTSHGEKWNQKFGLLCAFHRLNGHCRVQKNFEVESVKLGQWVCNQRHHYKNYMAGKKGSRVWITKERIDQLNSIGFDWKLDRKRGGADGWNEKFELLCTFWHEKGHCRVPKNFEVESVRLGVWVSHQRQFYKNFMAGQNEKGAWITQERIDQLNSIGFDWKMGRGDGLGWNEKFELLCTFWHENGHCCVPQNFEVESVKLGQWVMNQRQSYKNLKKGESKRASITQEHIDQLNSIGFEWNSGGTSSHDEKWSQKIELLCTFRRENGHCRVPTNFEVDSVKLGQWVCNQRTFYKNFMAGQNEKGACITQERIDQLNSLGFEWRLLGGKAGKSDHKGWNQKFDLLCAFQSENGHCHVPLHLEVESVKLGTM